jgi:FkbM family methyltransferase
MKLRVPWSVGYVWGTTRFVTLRSALRLRRLVARAARGESGPGLVGVRVKRPFRAAVWLRERGTDIDTFQEVVRNEIYRVVAERAGACEYALDLGGNIGLATLYLAGRFPGCKVLTVEPSPENQAVLARNVAPLVAAGRCRVVPGAVWHEDTTVDLSPVPWGAGFDSFTVSAAAELRQPVPAYTVETLLKTAGFPRADVVKIDIEGAEVRVFRGPVGWLARVNALAVEFHGDARRESGFDAAAAAAGLVVEDDRFPNCVVAYRRPGERVR